MNTNPSAQGHAARQPDWRHQFLEDLGGLVLVYGAPRAIMRVLGWLIVCNPPEQSAQQIQGELTLSAGSVSSAVGVLTDVGMAERVTRHGDRRIYYRVCPYGWERVLATRFLGLTEMREIAERALEASGDPSNERLVEMRDIYARFETGIDDLLRESAQRRATGQIPPGTTPSRPDEH